MQNKLSILFPRQEEVTYQMMPEETWHDLGLDALTEKVAKKPQEVQLLRRVMISLTDDPQVSAYRAEVFDDLYQHPDMREKMSELLEKVKSFYDYGVVNRHEGSDEGIWDLMHRLEEYHDYIITVEELRECLADRSLRSDGLRNLRETLDSIYETNGFAALREDVEAMRITAGEVKSLTVGINLNDRFEAVSMGLVTVNSKPFGRSGLLKNFAAAINPRDDIYPEADWNGSQSVYPATSPVQRMSANLNQVMGIHMAMRNPLLGLTLASIPQDDGSSQVSHQMDAAATMLVSRMTRRLRETLGRYLNISVRDISDLIPELLFYTRWSEFIEEKRSQGWTFTRPEVYTEPSSFLRMEATSLYNLKLLDTETPQSTVGNDLVFDEEKRVYVLTGANRGGKTTITQAVGQLFLLAQCGIPVPTEHFAFTPVDQVLTHFPADEDKTMDLGRLGEECKRFRSIFSQCTAHSLLLLNETFSTTSFEEGYYIALDALKAILQKDISTIYNTHMHKLAFDLDDQVNTVASRGKAFSLVAQTEEGKHTFRVRIAPPEGKSFAQDIAEKYGVTYDQLMRAESEN